MACIFLAATLQMIQGQLFVLEPADYARAMYFGDIEGVVHSHPEGTPVSEADRKACTQTGLPWFVYSVPHKKWLTIDP